MKTIRCSDCGAEMEPKEVSQEYEREGLRVRIDGIPAMVCPNCGDTSFAPGIANKIVRAANSLFELTEEKHRGLLVASTG